MSKRKYFGTDLDRVYSSAQARTPDFRVFIWNKHRCTINDVVLGREQSPRYDITPWVLSIDYAENIIFENNTDPIASNATMELIRDETATPEITERTLVDDTPIRIYQGDKRVSVDEWACIFTGVLRGNPSVVEEGRSEGDAQTMTVACVERAEAFLQTMVTSQSYVYGTDLGVSVVETAIKYMGLDREEINIGFQNYTVGHPYSQVIEMDVMNGLAQMLFVTGKKPRFDSEGFLVAADTDLDKAPARVHDAKDLIKKITRLANVNAVNNSVRLLGVDNQLTEVVEREKRLSHGSITSGYFESVVRQKINFSEGQGAEEGGRKAKNTSLKFNLSTIGEFFGETVSWQPVIEDDGYTCFGGKIVFDTGYDPAIRITLLTVWAVAKVTQVIAGLVTASAGLFTAAGSVPVSSAGLAAAGGGLDIAQIGETVSQVAMVGMILSLTEMGRVDWEIYGTPFQNIYQELCATAQLANLLTYQIKERQIQNNWIYDIATLQLRAKDMLSRELIQGWSYEIELMDDPLLEVDDVIQIGQRKYYITEITKKLAREPSGTMTISAWRIA